MTCGRFRGNQKSQKKIIFAKRDIWKIRPHLENYDINKDDINNSSNNNDDNDDDRDRHDTIEDHAVTQTSVPPARQH